MSDSKWVPIRDSILEALKLEDVGKGLKDKFVGWVGSEMVLLKLILEKAAAEEA